MVKMGEMNTGSIAIKDIIKGTLLSMIATIILLFIYAIMLTYTNISESTIPVVTIIITAISILAGSAITTLHIRKNGAINGGLVGIIYILSLYIISSIVTGNFSVNSYSIIMIAISLIAGMLGGIIGVNRK